MVIMCRNCTEYNMRQRPKESLLSAETVKRRIAVLTAEKEILEAKLDTLRKELHNIRLKCPHLGDKEHYPDASGNNADTTVCKDCGGSW